jgi:hypothetical protein
VQVKITLKTAAFKTLIRQVVSADEAIVRSASLAGIVAIAARLRDLNATRLVVALESLDWAEGGREEGVGFVEEV